MNVIFTIFQTFINVPHYVTCTLVRPEDARFEFLIEFIVKLRAFAICENSCVIVTENTIVDYEDLKLFLCLCNRIAHIEGVSNLHHKKLSQFKWIDNQ